MRQALIKAILKDRLTLIEAVCIYIVENHKAETYNMEAK